MPRALLALTVLCALALASASALSVSTHAHSHRLRAKTSRAALQPMQHAQPFAVRHAALIESLRALDEEDAKNDAEEVDASARFQQLHTEADSEMLAYVDSLGLSDAARLSALEKLVAVKKARANAEAEAEAQTHVWTPDVHTPVCKHMREYLVTVRAGIDLLATKPTDAALIDAWHLVWAAMPDSDVKRGGNLKATDVATKAAAAEIVRTVRYRIATGRTSEAAACDPAALKVGCKATAAIDKTPVPAYTLGVEWELHFAQITPETTNANVPVLAHSKKMPSPFGKIDFVQLKPDHKNHVTIAEVVFGPFGTTQGGANTQTSLTSITSTVEAIKDAFISEAAKVVQKEEESWGFASFTDIANAAYTGYGNTAWKDDHKITTIIDPNTKGYPSATLHEWHGRPTRANGGANNKKMKAKQMIQTNYMMPVSALAATKWIDFHKQVDETGGDPQYHMADLAKSAAGTYVTTLFPSTLWGALSKDAQADVFGAFTMFYHQTGYWMVKAWGKEFLGYGGHVKNMFHHMIKCELHDVVKALRPEAADAIHSWYVEFDFANAATIPAKAAYAAGSAQQKKVRDMFNVLRTAWLSSAQDQVKKWAGYFNDDAKDLTAHTINIFREKLLSWGALGKGGTGTSPIGGAPPPGYVVAKGNAGGVLCAVVESRKRTNNLNVAVAANDHTAVDAEMSPICHQHYMN